MNFQDKLDDTAQKYKNKTAIIFGSDRISFHELREQSLKLANVLKASGIRKGDKVALCLSNSPEYIFSYLACFCLGAVGVPLDFMLKEDELISCLEHSESKLLIAASRKDVDFSVVKRAVKGLERVISCAGEIADAIAERVGDLEAEREGLARGRACRDVAQDGTDRLHRQHHARRLRAVRVMRLQRPAHHEPYQR